MNMATTPEPTTVVLVHGAFADAGSWVPVIERLLAAGVPGARTGTAVTCAFHPGSTTTV